MEPKKFSPLVNYDSPVCLWELYILEEKIIKTKKTKLLTQQKKKVLQL